MGKKRKKSKGKKSKGKKNRQKRGASQEEVTPAEVEPVDVATVEVDIDAESSSQGNGDGGEALVDAVIDLDEDIDDPQARAELVAAVAGLEAPADDSDPAPEARTEDSHPAADPTAVDASATKDSEVAPEGDGTSNVGAATDIEGAGQADTDAEYGVSPTADAEGPLIGRDALLALTEFRREGVATLPEELILDLGDATTPEERDRLLAAALAHVEMQDAIYRVPLESGASRRWKGLIATAVFLMALFLAGLPPAFLVPEAPAPLTVAERADGIRMALIMQAEQIEAFQARAGRLPTSLTEVETALPGIRFVRSSNRLYQLIAYTSQGDAVVYDSASPDPSFAATEEVWARLRGDS